MSIARGRRWEVALHESGHLVTWLKLCKFPSSCSAHIRDNCGFAYPPKPLSDACEAIGTAAGNLAAEMLAGRYPVPDAVEVKPVELPRNTAAEIRQAEVVNYSFERIRKGDDDALSLAKACIQFKPDDPADWAQRYEQFITEARAMVEEHADEIHRVAKTLFATGHYEYEGDAEYENAIS